MFGNNPITNYFNTPANKPPSNVFGPSHVPPQNGSSTSLGPGTQTQRSWLTPSHSGTQSYLKSDPRSPATSFVFDGHNSSKAEVSSQQKVVWQKQQIPSFTSTSKHQPEKTRNDHKSTEMFSNMPNQSQTNLAANSQSLFKADSKGTSSVFPVGSQSPLKKWPAFTATQQPSTGTQVKFQPTLGVDAMFDKNGKLQSVKTHSQCCTVMKEYQNKSLEELRYEDYKMKSWGNKPQTPFMGNQIGCTAVSQPSFICNDGTNRDSMSNSFLSTTTIPKSNWAKVTTSGSVNPSSDTTKRDFSFTWPPKPPTTSMFKANADLFTTEPAAASNLFTTTGTWSIPTTSTTSWSLGSTPITSSSPQQITNVQEMTGFPAAAPASQSTFPATLRSMSVNNTAATDHHYSQDFMPHASCNILQTPASSLPVPPSLVNSGSIMFQRFGMIPAGGYSLHCLTTPMTVLALPHYHIHDPVYQNTTKPPFPTTPFKELDKNDDKFPGTREPITTSTLISRGNVTTKNYAGSKLPYKSSGSIYDLSRSPAVDKLTFANPKTNQSLSFEGRRIPKLFEGFEEESLIKGVDILSPTPNPKKLDLKVLRFTSGLKNETQKFHTNDPERLSKTQKPKIGDFEEPIQPPALENLVITDPVTISQPLIANESDKEASDSDVECASFLKVASNTNDTPNDPIKQNISGVTCTRHGYYTIPSLEELDKMTDDCGNCFVKEFIVGRNNVGRIRFLGIVNVSGVNIDEIVLFRHKVLEVYPDDINKPEVGVGLNCPAEIELENVWPLDKSTNDLIKDSDTVQRIKYDVKLKRACVRQNADFVEYCNKTGKWKFQVQHF